MGERARDAEERTGQELAFSGSVIDKSSAGEISELLLHRHHLLLRFGQRMLRGVIQVDEDAAWRGRYGWKWKGGRVYCCFALKLAHNEGLLCTVGR